ncbi:MAG: FAD:protein FMN transferase [Clostridia bacterium]|nr:FAD:protein FMN transferase [Clostridia bacterium]
MKKLLPFLLLVCLLPGCSAGDQETTQQFFAMDTVMTVTAYGSGGAEAAEAVQQEIFRLDQLLSRMAIKSDVSRLNAAAGSGESVALDPETASLLALAKGYADDLGKTFDPTIAPVMDAWGFGGDAYRVPGDGELAALIPLVNSDALTVSGDSAALAAPGMAVDLGGIAKGYAADQAVRILKEHGVSSALMNLGGNITVMGTRPSGEPWRVGVKDPHNLDAYVCVLALSDKTLSTSGAYERFFEEDGIVYHHIIDPSTGYPSESDLLSATVISATGAMDDAMSTAFFIMGADRAVDYWSSHEGFELVLIRKDGTILVTEGLEQSFTLNGEEGGYLYEIVRR